MEIRLNHQTRATEATRYYSLPGGATLVRKKDGLRYVANDHHGTGTATVDATGAITHRRMTPFGEARGAQPAQGVWPTEKGFVGGNQDSTTGLVNIGAREYDTITGRFISIDPIIDVNDPQQMNGYAYANNNPISFSDPDGLKSCSDDACGPGADFVDLAGKYHDVAGHNDGCHGCSGAYDPTVPGVNEHNNPKASPEARAAAAAAAAEKERQARIARAKQKILNSAKALAKILADELGLTDALNCFTKGDMGGCLATAVNVLSSVVGGALGKLAARYGAPWKWKKLANLVTRTKGLLGDLVSGVKNFFKASKCLHSFAAGTLVLMADGTKKPIEKVKPGEKVLATDPASGKTKAQAVVATHINLDVDLTDITVDTAGKDTLLQTTAHHPFWSKDRRTWVNATDLRKSENLVTVSGSSLPVSTSMSYSGARVMYDLTVDTIHTYYVIAGKASVLVHNVNRAGCEFGDAVKQAAVDDNLVRNDGMLRCDYCNTPIQIANQSKRGVRPPGNDLAYDHFDPVKLGGKGGRNNIITACRDCNGEKSDMPGPEWLAGLGNVRTGAGSGLRDARHLILIELAG
jgi:RHS repeat-associated protein